MKKIFKVLFVCCLVAILSGCYKYNTEMEINTNKELLYKATIAIDKTAFSSMAEEMGGETTEEVSDDEATNELSVDEEELKQKGYEVTEYKEVINDHEWVGYTLSKKFANIDDLLLAQDEVVDLSNTETDEEGNTNYGIDGINLFSKNGDTYKAQFLFNYADEETEEPDESMVDNSQLASMFDFTFQITLPEAAVSNNATEVLNDGKTLKWKLEYGKKNEVNFEFKIPEAKTPVNEAKEGNLISTITGNKTILYGGIAAIVVIIVVVVLVSRKKKPAAEVAPTPEVAPVTTEEATNSVLAEATPVAPEVAAEPTPVVETPAMPEVTAEPVVEAPVTPEVAEPAPVVETPVAPAIDDMPTTVIETPVMPEVNAEVAPAAPVQNISEQTTDQNNQVM